jgi:hypothetical protein
MAWTGGCQCGAVRFRVEGELGRPSICHCRMCQKAFAGPFGALVTAKRDEVAWTRGAPSRFQSSDTIRRGFCRDCGTPLTFESEKNFDLAIFAFDRAHDITPVIQLEPQRGAAWLAHVAEMEVLEPPPGYLEGIVSRQHPDHDTDAWPPAA